MLSESDKAEIQAIVYKEVALMQVAIVERLRAELFEGLQALISEQHQHFFQPIADGIGDVRKRLTSLEQGISDAASQIVKNDAADPDDWWKGDADE